MSEVALENMASMVAALEGEMEDFEDIETQELEMEYESHDSTFITRVKIEVLTDADGRDIMEATHQEIYFLCLDAEIAFDDSDTLDAQGGLLFPNSLKVIFTFDNGDQMVVDGIEYDTKLRDKVISGEDEDGSHGADIFVNYVMPAVREQISWGEVRFVPTEGDGQPN